MSRLPRVVLIGRPQHNEGKSIESDPLILESLKIDDFEGIYAMNPEVIILGTGLKQIFPEREILKHLVQNRIGYEIMDTQAACRTFNIIMAEGRNVVAGMFI